MKYLNELLLLNKSDVNIHSGNTKDMKLKNNIKKDCVYEKIF